MILFVQNLCSATREVLKCTRRYSSSFEDDLRGLVKLGFRSPLDMLPGRATNGGASQQRAAIAAYHSAPHALQRQAKPQIPVERPPSRHAEGVDDME